MEVECGVLAVTNTESGIPHRSAGLGLLAGKSLELLTL